MDRVKWRKMCIESNILYPCVVPYDKECEEERSLLCSRLHWRALVLAPRKAYQQSISQQNCCKPKVWICQYVLNNKTSCCVFPCNIKIICYFKIEFLVPTPTPFFGQLKLDIARLLSNKGVRVAYKLKHVKTAKRTVATTAKSELKVL